MSYIADKIFALESSRGKADGCEKFGKVNGYGFRQNKDQYVCYNSHQEVEKLVENWLTQELKTHDLATTLCGYNLGFSSKYLKACVNQSSSYPYYKNYLIFAK